MKLFYNQEANVGELIERLRRLFSKDGYDVKPISKDILEISKTSDVRNATGLSVRVRITITAKRNETHVELSNHVEEYVTKGVIAAVAAVFSAGILATLPAYGALRQKQLMATVKEQIDDYFNDKLVE